MVGVRVEQAVPDQIQGRNPHHVNHAEELDAAMAVARRHDGNRIVVFAGLPGVGKTALAVELSFRVRDEFPSGRLLGRLSGGPAQPGIESAVLGDFLIALGERAEDLPDRLDARRSMFQTRTAGGRFQVLLDGAVSAAQVRTLLPGDGASLIMVTEGRPLSALGADSAVTFLDLSPLGDEAARELVGRLVGADRVTAEPAAVTELIRLCGHLPVALCVVGALVRRSRSRTFGVMVERLRDERRRLPMLSRGDDLSVASVFTAAYRLLDDSAQRCYRALGLRPRSTEISVAAVAAALDLPDDEVREMLDELADTRLVDELGPDRVGVRELVQLHAEHLDDRAATGRRAESMRLLEYYLAGTAAADDLVSPARPWRDALFPDLERGPAFADQDAARSWLRTERANLCAAVDHAFDLGEYDMVVQWCVLLWPFYEKEKFLDDLFAVHDRGIKAAWRLSAPATESLLHVQVGYAHYWLRDLAVAVESFRKGLELAVRADSVELEATAAEGWGLAELARGELERSVELLERNRKLAERTGDDRRIALAGLHLAKALPPVPALALLDAARVAFDRLGAVEPDNLAKVALWRGRKLIEADRTDDVEDELVAALDTMAARGRRFDQAEALHTLGDLAVAQRAPDRAAERYREALGIVEDLGFAAPAAAIRDKLTVLTSSGSSPS